MIILPGDWLSIRFNEYAGPAGYIPLPVYYWVLYVCQNRFSRTYCFHPAFSIVHLGFTQILWPDFLAMIDHCTFCWFSHTYWFNPAFPNVHPGLAQILPLEFLLMIDHCTCCRFGHFQHFQLYTQVSSDFMAGFPGTDCICPQWLGRPFWG